MRKAILLLFLGLLSLGLKAQDQDFILKQILSVNSKIKSIDANLDENQALHNGKNTKDKGKLYYSAQDKFSMRFDNGDKVIVNGNKLYLDHGIFRGTFNSNRNSTMRSLSSLMLYSFQGRCKQLADECGYNIALKTDKGYHKVTLTIKKKKLLSYSVVELYYSTVTYHLEKMVLTAYNDDVAVYSVSNVKYDLGVNSKLFEK